MKVGAQAMAELTTSDRLQPCLLDRLTDDESDKGIESRERRVITVRQLRNAVLRDLTWLFNSHSRSELDELDEFPLVRDSVLNFGVPDHCGQTNTSISEQAIERQIRDAVLRYEPRILPNTLSIKAKTIGHSVTFEIQGDMWAQPVPDPLFVRTELDLETGGISLKEAGRG